MKSFITDGFLLENDASKELYHNFAESQPIIDYHSHLSPSELAQNKVFENITQLWIEGDHYKWRAMRALGIPEEYITGNRTDEEKFIKWAETVPYTMRNPLYHWTHLELLRYFSIDELLSKENAREVFKRCNALLKSPEYTSQGLIDQMNVKVICTTDDPLDNLGSHRTLSKSDFATQVLPTFRPDKLIHIEKDDFNVYISVLSDISGIQIKDLESLKAAIALRVDYFHDHGCRLSDHGLTHVYGAKFSATEVNTILKDRLNEKSLSTSQQTTYKAAILNYLGTLYADKGWVMQLHLGSIRDNNKRILEKIGLDAGVDSIGDYQHAETLAAFLNGLNDKGALPKTILYNSNPSDNELFATMAGNFTGEHIKSKLQFGTAWWFMDQRDGIIRQLEALSNMGLLSCSVGMLTDSRSFLSFPRHEYYRRILCNIFGTEIEKGLLPADMNWIGKIIQDITYNNARDFFQFPALVENNKS